MTTAEPQDIQNAALQLQQSIENQDLFGLNAALEGSRAIVETIIAKETPTHSELEFVVQWNLMAIDGKRMIERNLPAPETYPHIPRFREIVDATREGEPQVSIFTHTARVKLMMDFGRWATARMSQGYEPKLSDEEFSWYEQQTEVLEAEAQADLAIYADQEAWEPLVSLKHELTRYYLQVDRPNDALSVLKEQLTVLEKLPDYHVSMRAEVLGTLGSILAHYSKKEAATRYLDEAIGIYKGLGEEFEADAATLQQILTELS